MPGDGLAHGPPANKKAGGSHHRSSRIIRHSLRDGFNGFLRTLPGDRAFLPPSLAGSSASLASASGGQDHTTLPYASASFVRATSAATPTHPPHPRLTSRDDRAYVPLHRGGMCGIIVVICPTRQAQIPAADWHDGQFGHSTHAQFARRARRSAERAWFWTSRASRGRRTTAGRIRPAPSPRPIDRGPARNCDWSGPDRD
jgi:hypothetical protein